MRSLISIHFVERKGERFADLAPPAAALKKGEAFELRSFQIAPATGEPNVVIVAQWDVYVPAHARVEP